MIEVKAYHKYELADKYGVTAYTFGLWVKSIEPDLIATGYKRDQKILTPKQVQLIFDRLGEP